MSSPKSLKQKLAQVRKLWDRKSYDDALAIVEELREAAPDNPRLLIMWANLVQLQEKPAHSLAEVKAVLERAVELDGPAAAIELGHYLDAVEDDPEAAVEMFADAAGAATGLLIDALLGQARALLQLDRKREAILCLVEALHLANLDVLRKKSKSVRVDPYLLLNSALQGLQQNRPNGAYAELESLASDVLGTPAESAIE